MRINFLKFLIFFLILISLTIFYLSIFGIETKKFNQQIKDKVSQSNKAEIGWGHQIRSYVLQPYRLVKDNRTNFESTSPEKILDGEIDEFLEQSLYKIK